jgi:hypothetical protein
MRVVVEAEGCRFKSRLDKFDAKAYFAKVKSFCLAIFIKITSGTYLAFGPREVKFGLPSVGMNPGQHIGRVLLLVRKPELVAKTGRRSFGQRQNSLVLRPLKTEIRAYGL